MLEDWYVTVARMYGGHAAVEFVSYWSSKMLHFHFQFSFIFFSIYLKKIRMSKIETYIKQIRKFDLKYVIVDNISWG